jgi:hypothetical protein
VGENCAGRWPWDGDSPPCPGKGRILEEPKSDALFCTDDDGGESECEKSVFDECVVEYINTKDQCAVYDYTNNNCIQWVNDVREVCRKKAKEQCTKGK